MTGNLLDRVFSASGILAGDRLAKTPAMVPAFAAALLSAVAALAMPGPADAQTFLTQAPQVETLQVQTLQVQTLQVQTLQAGTRLAQAPVPLPLPAQRPAAPPDQSAVPPAASDAAEAARKAAAAKVQVPNFWNVERRLERPDAARLPKSLRFVTSDDYPPFNFVASNGALSGFNVDLARAICDELGASCTIQVEPFAALTDAVDQGRADAAIAGVAATPQARARLAFSERYLGTPARFVARRGLTLQAATPEHVANKKVAVVSRTAHEAYLRSFFNEAAIRTYADLKGAQDALKKGEVDLIFADGIAMALWLNGTDSDGCCAFVGGAFTESRFFGEGFAVAVKADNEILRDAMDYALQRIWEKGVYTDIYLRWFPLSVY